MNKKQQEQQNRQKNLNKFNGVTEEVKPENQNQDHNVRSEAVETKNRQVQDVQEGVFSVASRHGKDYTKFRRLRMGKWGADGEMKKTKDKAVWTWIKKHKKQVVLWGGIILIAVPLIVYGLYEISLLPVTGGNDWAGFWGGYFGAIIGGICTVVGVFLSIQYEREKGQDDAERAVLPYIALTTLEKEYRVDYFNLKTSRDIKDEEPDGYKEIQLNEIYFVIRGEEAIPNRKLTKQQKLLLENNGYNFAEIEKGMRYLTQQKFVSVPILLTNVGNGAAINFRIGFHLSNIKYNGKNAKYTVAKHLEKGSSFYLNLFFEDLNVYAEGKEFVLRIHYENIYSQGYLQEYPVLVDSGQRVKLDLGYRQKKCE